MVIEANGFYDFSSIFFGGKKMPALSMPVKNRKMPKNIFFAIFSKTGHRIPLNFCMVIEGIELYLLA